MADRGVVIYYRAGVEDFDYDTGFVKATDYEALRKRCEAVEADAARYRWLIANQVEYRDGDDGLAWMTMQWNLGPASLAPGCIDAAISQAIAAAQEPSHG